MKDWRNIALIIFATCLVFGGYLALQEHDARIRSEATIAAIKENTKQEVRTVEVERKAADTPEKQIQYVNKYIPIELRPASKPTVSSADTVPPALNLDAPALNLSTLPDSPGYVFMSQDKLPVLSDYVEACNKTGIELKGCRAEVEEYKKQRGGFWHKVGQCAARGGVGSGGVAIGQIGSGNTKGLARNAGIGFAFGASTCFIWKP